MLVNASERAQMVSAANKENMLACVQALESGEYPQGRTALAQIVNGQVLYCCLGVFCEVAMRHGVPVRKQNAPLSTGIYCYDGEATALPRSVSGWLGLGGLSGRNPVLGISSDGHWRTAIDANDTELWTFPEIAGAFRKFYELGGDEPQGGGDGPGPESPR